MQYFDTFDRLDHQSEDALFVFKGKEGLIEVQATYGSLALDEVLSSSISIVFQKNKTTLIELCNARSVKVEIESERREQKERIKGREGAHRVKGIDQ